MNDHHCAAICLILEHAIITLTKISTTTLSENASTVPRPIMPSPPTQLDYQFTSLDEGPTRVHYCRPLRIARWSFGRMLVVTRPWCAAKLHYCVGNTDWNVAMVWSKDSASQICSPTTLQQIHGPWFRTCRLHEVMKSYVCLFD